MKFHTVFVIFFLIFNSEALFSQMLPDVFNCPKEEKFLYARGAKLRIQQPVMGGHSSVVTDSGSMTIFRISKLYDCPDAFDEAVEHFIYIVIPSEKDAFELKSTWDSLSTEVYSTGYLYGYRPYIHFMTSVKGYIKGNRIGDQWILECDLTVSFQGTTTIYRSYQRQFKGSYTFSEWRGKNRKQYPGSFFYDGKRPN